MKGDIWILSQDKKKLMLCKEISVVESHNGFVMACNNKSVSNDLTLEKGLEIINDIQELLIEEKPTTIYHIH